MPHLYFLLLVERFVLATKHSHLGPTHFLGRNIRSSSGCRVLLDEVNLVRDSSDCTQRWALMNRYVETSGLMKLKFSIPKFLSLRSCWSAIWTSRLPCTFSTGFVQGTSDYHRAIDEGNTIQAVKPFIVIIVHQRLQGKVDSYKHIQGCKFYLEVKHRPSYGLDWGIDHANTDSYLLVS